MPELPEVESVRAYLCEEPESRLGRKIQAVTVHRASVVDGVAEALTQCLTGCRIAAITRHGKYLFFISDGDAICMAMHLRMTGRCLVASQEQPLHQHTRISFLFDDAKRLEFIDPRAFGRVWLVHAASEVTKRLGPDGLTVTQKTFLARMAEKSGVVKALLLDQAFIAGVGNIYADESLFRAGIHPQTKVATLTVEQRKRLYSAVHFVLTDAVRRKGANIDGVFEAGHFPVAVYGRSSLPCPVCHTLIEKIKVVQRGTHFCPVCQPSQLAKPLKTR